MGIFDFINKGKKESEPEVQGEQENLEGLNAEELTDSADDPAGGEEGSENSSEVISDDEKSRQEQPKPPGFFSKLVSGLSKTRENILSGVDEVLKSFQKIDEDLFDELEEAFIMADMGVATTEILLEKLRQKIKEEKVTEPSMIKNMIAGLIAEMLTEDTDEKPLSMPAVVLVIGVNGVGKTTTIGKMAHYYKSRGKNVLLAAGDTFRAAAIDQLEIWGKRTGVDVVKHQEGADPGAVIFDGIQAAKARNVDVLICDTAGRLHNKKNLMEELRKIDKIMNREYPDAQKEVLLVLDATTGQNAVQQAKLFKEVADITGIVLTKLDGTAKGGVVVAIKSELNIPVKFIGVGEQMDDMQPFDAKEFAEALFNI